MSDVAVVVVVSQEPVEMIKTWGEHWKTIQAGNGLPDATVIVSPSYSYATIINDRPNRTDAEFLLLVHPDCLPQKGFMEGLMAEMEDGVAAVGCHQSLPENTGYRTYHEGGAVVNRPHRGNEPTLMTMINYPHGAPRPFNVQWVSYACALLRVKALNRVPLDESYPGERWVDADHGMALRKAGWRVRYTPRVAAIHDPHGSWRGREDAFHIADHAAKRRFAERWPDAEDGMEWLRGEFDG